MNATALIPRNIRLRMKLILRHFRDLLTGQSRKFAKPVPKSIEFQYFIQLTQDIRPSPLYENKKENIKIACAKIESVMLYPGEILSFWKIVGRPSPRNGFKKGRNIIAGQLIEDYGGGLCQVSGILYHLALIGGLDIPERHNHSVDIYTDDTRYAPLGSDATVVYGYKDLRIKNNYNYSIQFRFEVNEDHLTAILCSKKPVRERRIKFLHTERPGGIDVLGCDDDGAFLNTSRYARQ